MTLDLQDASNDYAPQQYQGHGIVSQSILGRIQPGKLSTTFDDGPPTRIDYQILATDYKNYAFVWDCLNVNATHYNEKMWYYDRQRNAASRLNTRPSKVQQLVHKYFDNKTYKRATYQGQLCTN